MSVPNVENRTPPAVEWTVEPTPPGRLRPIGEAAGALGVHPRTLMAYERIGILKPRRRSNRRVYTDDEIRWVGCVQDLNRRGGISLHGLAALLRFVPCWAVRSAAGSRGPKESGLPEFPAGSCLDRVHRAYDGEAPEPCVTCGVFLRNRNTSRNALARSVLGDGSGRGEPRT